MNKYFLPEERERYLGEAKRYAQIMDLPRRINTDVEAQQILLRWNVPHDELVEDGTLPAQATA